MLWRLLFIRDVITGKQPKSFSDFWDELLAGRAEEQLTADEINQEFEGVVEKFRKEAGDG